MTGKRPAARPVWTEAEIKALGAKTDVETAGSIFGLSRTQAYEAVKAGRFPVPVLTIGNHLVVPTAPILQVLKIGTDRPGESNPSAVNPDELADLVAERVVNYLARALMGMARADPLPTRGDAAPLRVLKPGAASGGPEAA